MNNNSIYNTLNKENNFQISKMTLNDLDLLSNILTTNFDDFWEVDTLKKELLSDSSTYFCVKDISTNSIIGFCGIKINLDTADLMNIVVRKGFRNLGVGSLLLKSIILFCNNYNYNNTTSTISSIFLEVNENNLNAIKLYEKYNFYKISIRKNYYKNQNAIIMKLNLS